MSHMNMAGREYRTDCHYELLEGVNKSIIIIMF